MTAIAYKGGIMAADTAVWSGHVIVHHHKKIIRVAGRLAAAAGESAAIGRFRQWMFDGGNGDFDRSDVGEEGFEAFVVQPDTTMLWMGRAGPLVRIDAPFFAFGSAHEVMTGALAAGASAETAVKIAITYTPYAAGGIQVEHLDNGELRGIIGGPMVT